GEPTAVPDLRQRPHVPQRHVGLVLQSVDNHYIDWHQVERSRQEKQGHDQPLACAAPATGGLGANGIQSWHHSDFSWRGRYGTMTIATATSMTIAAAAPRL